MTNDLANDMEILGRRAKEASRTAAKLKTEEKNRGLLAVARELRDETAYILTENAKDLQAAEEKGIKESLIDRLRLTEQRIEAMAAGLEQVVALADPVGEVLGMKTRPNGLRIGKKRVPLGVVGIIYESRPNVTADAFGLCFKTGNAVILRGGSDAIHSNLAIYSLRACAGENKNRIELAEFTINNQKDYILQEIYKAKPDVLCFSCYIWNIDYVESIAKEFHKLCPQVPVWLGGPEVSYEVEAFLQQHPEITGVMIGEGEDTFRELCQYYARDEKMPQIDSLDSIRGIAFTKEDKVVFTSAREIMDMSQIPFCYDTMEDFSNRII